VSYNSTLMTGSDESHLSKDVTKTEYDVMLKIETTVKTNIRHN